MSAGSAVSATQIYSAKYSGVEVYEFLHPTGSIMKRKADDWVNATHILKAAKFAKAKRTRILEKEVIKDTHEKVQGGFGKYQGTWVPLDIARRLAQKFEVLEELRPLFDFTRRDGSESPPQAPKHHHASRADSARKRTTKSPPLPHGQLDALPKRRGRPPRARKLSDVANVAGQTQVYSDFPRPSIPVSSISSNQLPSLQSTLHRSISIEHNRNKAPPQPNHKYEELDIEDGLSSDIETSICTNMVYAGHSNARLPMNTSLLPDKEEPGLSSSLPSSPSEFSAPMVFDTQRMGSATSPLGSMLPRYMAPSRPRTSELDQKANEYLSKLVDYFINCEVQNNGAVPMELLNPPHSSPCIDSWIDSEHHTAFHWACAMGTLPIVEALLQAGASPRALNQAGETPLMRASLFHNSYTKRTYPRIFQLLQDTVFDVDSRSQTVVHHIVKRKSNTPSALYYLDVLLSKLKDFSPQYRIETLINAQDCKGSTPLHIAAMNRDKKFFQTLVGNGALSTIKNHDGVTADELINNRFVKTIQPTQRGNYHENRASHSPLNSASAAGGMVPASLIHTGDMYPSQSATSVSRAIPEVINLMKDMADSYQFLYEDRNQEVQDVVKMLKSMSATVTSLDMKVLEILEVKDMNNITYEMDSLKENIAGLKQKLSEKQKVLVSLLEKSQRVTLRKCVEEEKKAIESVIAAPADDATHSSKETLADDLRELTVLQLRRKHKINRLIELLCGNSKIHKFRKMISQGTDMDISEVDNFLDVIFQQLNEDEENTNNGGHTNYNGHVSCAILDTVEGYGIENIENKRGTSQNDGPAK
ncbi:AFR600Cp [Eremothecium gossypii ATCC 10895]|uniref:Transcription factor MBP1 n=1 Tax=Eremothecium gossypii (strain ATCC 10895 / CBS 109.51 / FGSC 9923 / NRRL Y-1056) TaxID=284811 RepID=Q752H3_EREGS|nr:AFR600Cp [Eremothecium gossypii ATCC 10895]AAS53971.2 AFR600Cp [Eremothecium gossypii ATCC 10895]AEY98285.1 FAFR600Cp [Eremothecium gossypii FDAG1]